MRGTVLRRVLAACLVAAVAGPACTGSGARTGTRSSPPASGPLLPLPRPTDRPVNADFDYGQDVEITAGAFVPRELVSAVNFPITWTNHSGLTQDIHFDNDGNIDSGPILPGGTWIFTPNTTVSIVYHSTIDPSLRGGVQVQPLTEP